MTMIVMMMPRILIRMKIKEWGHGHNHGQQSQIAATGVYHDEGKDEKKYYVFSKKGIKLVTKLRSCQ